MEKETLTKQGEVKSQKEKVKKVEDIKHRSYRFSITIIKFIKKYKRRDLTTEIIFKQLLRSSTSVGANIIEGEASPTRKDFRNYYNIALKSANETKYWLCLMKDTSDFNKDEIQLILQEINEISKILGSIIVKLRD